MIDVAVIGAGVSGLATAYELRCRGHRVVVLERQIRAGGNAVSERIGGFLMEHGPSSVNAAVPIATQLSHSLGLDPLRCTLTPEVRYRYLTGAGKLHRIATHPLGFFTSDYLSLRARLRLLTEVLVPTSSSDDEETVAQFWRRRFGAEFAERVIDPLVGGLYAGKASELSMMAVFPTLINMERRYGSIIQGVLRRRLASGNMPGRRLYSWQQGIGTLPTTLAQRLGPALKTGIVVRRIKALPEGFRIETGASGVFKARAVVMATQPQVAATLLDGIDTMGAEAAASIDTPSLAVVFLGYRRQQVAHPLNGLGYLTPTSAQRELSGALFCSTMFAARAPTGHVSLSAYIGGARAPALARLPTADLIALARAEFRDLLGVRGDPVVVRVRQWPQGLPQYHLGHGQLVAVLHGIEERQPGLFVTGNYFVGPSVGNCLTQANETAVRIHRFLGAHGAIAQTSTPAALVGTVY